MKQTLICFFVILLSSCSKKEEKGLPEITCSEEGGWKIETVDEIPANNAFIFMTDRTILFRNWPQNNKDVQGSYTFMPYYITADFGSYKYTLLVETLTPKQFIFTFYDKGINEIKEGEKGIVLKGFRSHTTSPKEK